MTLSPQKHTVVPRADEGPQSALFSISDLTKHYVTGDITVKALRGISLDITAGELLVLLGPSGSGKSTLLNILGGLDRATSGQVLFQGENLTEMNDRGLTRFRRDHIGFIFQFYNLIPSLTARENVDLVTEIATTPLATEEALSLVGLHDRMDHFPSELSGGEQQRVAVARAIAKRPQVLLCDEPTGALDSATGIKVLEALEQVNLGTKATTMIITHNMSIAEMADRVIYFADGQINKIETIGRRRKPSELEW